MFGCMQGTRPVKSDEYSRLGWHLKDYSTAADFAPHPPSPPLWAPHAKEEVGLDARGMYTCRI